MMYSITQAELYIVHEGSSLNDVQYHTNGIVYRTRGLVVEWCTVSHQRNCICTRGLDRRWMVYNNNLKSSTTCICIRLLTYVHKQEISVWKGHNPLPMRQRILLLSYHHQLSCLPCPLLLCTQMDSDWGCLYLHCWYLLYMLGRMNAALEPIPIYVPSHRTLLILTCMAEGFVCYDWKMLHIQSENFFVRDNLSTKNSNLKCTVIRLRLGQSFIGIRYNSLHLIPDPELILTVFQRSLCVARRAL